MHTYSFLVFGLCYVLVFILSWATNEAGNFRLINNNGNITENPGNVIGFHIIGLLWLGPVPVFFLDLPVLKTITGDSFPGNIFFVFFLLVWLLVMLLAGKFGRNAGKLTCTDHTNKQLPAFFPVAYFIIRSIFLFVYEFFFRGLLLFTFTDALGTTLAVILNVSLYTVLHFFNSKKEILACIPFGLLTCWFCIVIHAAWPAILLHISFSILYEKGAYQLRHASPQIIRP